MTGVTCNMIAPGWVDTPNERLIQARHGRPDFPGGNPQPHHARGDRRGGRLPGVRPARKINGVILYLDAGLHIADDAGMVHLPDRSRPPYEQRIEDLTIDSPMASRTPGRAGAIA